MAAAAAIDTEEFSKTFPLQWDFKVQFTCQVAQRCHGGALLLRCCCCCSFCCHWRCCCYYWWCCCNWATHIALKWSDLICYKTDELCYESLQLFANFRQKQLLKSSRTDIIRFEFRCLCQCWHNDIFLNKHIWADPKVNWIRLELKRVSTLGPQMPIGFKNSELWYYHPLALPD